jgi:hypothetical protein
VTSVASHYRSFTRALANQNQYADLLLSRARAEIELLVAIAAGPRQAGMVLDGLGIGSAYFQNPDTSAIFGVLLRAGDASWGTPPWSCRSGASFKIKGHRRARTYQKRHRRRNTFPATTGRRASRTTRTW